MKKQAWKLIVRILKAGLVLLNMTLVTTAFGQAGNGRVDSNELPGFNAAEMTRDAPAYETIGRMEESWSLVSYMVNEQGQAEDMVVLDSSGRGRTDELAKEEMEFSTFTPATLNGTPVSSAMVSRYVLEIGDSALSSREFVTDINAFNQAIDEQDAEEAERILGNIKARRIRGNYEYMQISLAEFRLGVLKGDMTLVDQIRHLERVVVEPAADEKLGFKDYLPDEVRAGAEQSLLTLYLRSNRFAEAFDLFYDIEPSLSAELNHVFQPAMARSAAIRESDQAYLVHGKLSETGAWLLPLFKAGFAVNTGIEDIDQARLRCDVGQYVVALEADTDYQVPEGRGRCSLLMQGEPGAEITLVQF